MNKFKHLLRKKIMWIVLALVLLYLLLSIPGPGPKPPAPSLKKAFLWNQDHMWSALEKKFREARELGCEKLEEPVDLGISEIEGFLATLETSSLGPEEDIFYRLENQLFNLAPMIGACPERLPDYIALFGRVRQAVKQQSRSWDMNLEPSRHCLYRLLYGGRAALEEVMLQAPPAATPPLVKGEAVPSSTPMASILGVNIHSGDILVSRGGAPTSALISRGNDYPGNFSHIALVHVDEKTHLVSIIEAHIEIGVAIADLEAYLKDKKLRVMVMRPRADLPALVKDPMLPHKAASYALKQARERHIPYDFGMDYTDRSKLFCSEVASAAYGQFGVTLWMGISSISSPGLVSWLGAFGVEHFETQEPSDLEYDPQLQVVAEWRDRETLYNDHLDNAVIDVMLEGAEKGEALTYKWYLLAPARVMKAYSALLSLFGGAGPIPEGMSATAALKNEDFSGKHKALKEQLSLRAKVFKKEKGYTPPYWELINLARAVKEKG